MELRGLVSWLRFNQSPTDDFVKNNQWTTYGNPTVSSTNAISGNALQLDGQSYLKLSNVKFGGSSYFMIDGWVYVDSSSPDNARLISIVNPANGYHLLSVRKSKNDSTKLDVWFNSYADVSADNGYTLTANLDSIGRRVHFRVTTGVNSGTTYIYFSINGASYSSTYRSIPTGGYNSQNFDIYIGAYQNGSQGLIGSVDELCVYNGMSLASSYTSPTADYYNSTTLTTNFDSKRTVKNPPITWRYENPGTADLLTIAGTTVTNLAETQSKTGTAFYQPTRSKCFDIPATKEIWLKCDIYTTASYKDNDRIRIYSDDSSGVNGFSTHPTITNNVMLWHNGTSQSNLSGLVKNKNRSFLLHMVSDATNGVVEYFFANGNTDKFTGNVNNGNNFDNVYIQMDGSNILVSNLIISNAPLDLTDDVAELLTNAVEFNADTLRIVKKALETSIDTARNIVTPEVVNFSIQREIVKSVALSADTSRGINRTIDLFFDAERKIYLANLTPVTVNFDVVRNLVKPVVLNNDTLTKIQKTLSLDFDTTRITNKLQFYYDVIRKIKKSVELNFDTSREVNNFWHYENYGTADLTYNSEAVTLEVGYSKSRTGYAYRCGDYAFYDDIPQSKEVWIKLDFYFDSDAVVGTPDFKELAVGIVANSLRNQVVFIGDQPSYSLINSNLPSSTDFRNSNYRGAIDSNNPVEYNHLYRLLVHIKSDSTNGVIEYWIDNGKYLSYTGNVNNGNYFNRIFAQILRFPNYSPLLSNVIISNAPININEDVSSHIGGALSADFDTCRKILNPPLTFRYENCGTTDTLLCNATQIATTKDKAKYLSGFYQTNESKTFDLPATDEVWIKFDFYIEGIQELSTGWSIGVGNLNADADPDFNDYDGINIGASFSGYGAGIDYCSSYEYISEFESYSKSDFNNLNSCLLRMKSGVSDGLLEVWINGILRGYYVGNINNGESFDNLVLYSVEDSYRVTPLFSNVLISNSEIELSENCKYPTEFFADAEINTLGDLTVFPHQASFKTVRNVVKQENVYFDTIRQPCFISNVDFDACRNVKSPVQIDYDTARSIPHKFKIIPVVIRTVTSEGDESSDTLVTPATEENSDTTVTPAGEENSDTSVTPVAEENSDTLVTSVTFDAGQTTSGTQSFEVNIAAQQLTDQINYTGIVPAVIMEQIQGQFLDYFFDVRIEKIRNHGVLFTYECCSDIDEILYRQLGYKIPEDEQWHDENGNDIYGRPVVQNDDDDESPMGLASTHISYIADNMGKQPALYFDDFVSTVDVEANGITYNDLISSIFGWTSRIPHQLINVFLRNEKLFVVQRGHEPNTIDLTDTKHTLPIIDSELVRTAWGSTVWSETKTRELKRLKKPNWVSSDENGGIVYVQQGNNEYSLDDDGLVKSSRVVEGDTITTTDYYYDTLSNGRKVLTEERTTVTQNYQIIDQKTTYHTYLGQGQSHSTSYDGDGEYLGGSVGANRGDDRVTSYIQYGEATAYKAEFDSIKQQRTIYGLALMDTSFPVHGDDKLTEITAAINWLNRRTMEKITMTIYDYPHLIDFTDKIIFNGYAYFLESNTAFTNQRIINQQNVSFVRWF